jgi:beta-lactamase class A
VYSRRRRKKNRLGRIVVLILVIFFAYSLISRFFSHNTLNTLGASTSFTKSDSNSKQHSNKVTIESVVKKALEGSEGNYAVSIKNLKTGESFYMNDHSSFEAGSLYKLWIMTATFKEIEKGDLKEDEELFSSIDNLNREFDIDPDLAELTGGTINLTVSSALNQMITISHNYAALLLTKRIKLSTVADLLDSDGFHESKVGTDGSYPTTTASDISLFYEKLYKGELASLDSTTKMIELLKNQKLNNKLPRSLPEGTVIAHKTGEIDFFSHDAGIVYSPKGDYVIVVLSESKSPAGAEERIADISKAVYDYFNK